MPHLTLEYSKNVCEHQKLDTLFEKCHALMVEILPTELASCKSKALEYKNYYIGDGNTKNAFVHLDLKLLTGRTEETLHALSQRLLQCLSEHFAESFKTLNLQISLEITELSKIYFRILSPTHEHKGKK